jgi:hypothetical protein
MTGNSFYDTVSGFTPVAVPDNTYYTARPSGSKVFLRPSTYEPGRAYLTVYNWDLDPTVDVDVSSIMAPGASWTLKNAQNPFGPAVATGTYDGGPLSIPMTAMTPATPVGASTARSDRSRVQRVRPRVHAAGRVLRRPGDQPVPRLHLHVSTLGITAGCGGGNFCPNSPVKRSQMAVFLLKAEHGVSYAPPPATGTVFSDVAKTAFAAAWIERLKAEGITSGCGSGKLLPQLLRQTEPDGGLPPQGEPRLRFHAPPPASGDVFSDVHSNSFAAAWIEDLPARGITSGCGGGKYCPSSVSSRGQMAAFLVSTFGLN